MRSWLGKLNPWINLGFEFRGSGAWESLCASPDVKGLGSQGLWSRLGFLGISWGCRVGDSASCGDWAFRGSGWVLNLVVFLGAFWDWENIRFVNPELFPQI